jgi:hypothetical protein
MKVVRDWRGRRGRARKSAHSHCEICCRCTAPASNGRAGRRERPAMTTFSATSTRGTGSRASAHSISGGDCARSRTLLLDLARASSRRGLGLGGAVAREVWQAQQPVHEAEAVGGCEGEEPAHQPRHPLTWRLRAPPWNPIRSATGAAARRWCTTWTGWSLHRRLGHVAPLPEPRRPRTPTTASVDASTAPAR